MKRFVTAALALAFVGGLAPAPTAAQITVFIDGGATIPTGDYGDYANTGWMGSAGVTVPVGESGLFVAGTGFYGSNNHSDIDGDKTNLLGGVGSLGYAIASDGSMMPYVFGSVGFMQHSYKSDTYPDLEDSVSGLAFGGGAGVSFPLGGINGNVQGAYIMGSGDIDGTQFFSIGAGIGIPLGGDAM
jgi:hypothetical protein